MKKEEITILAQLLTTMQEGVEKLEKADKERDTQKIIAIKNEVLSLQRKMKEILQNDR